MFTRRLHKFLQHKRLFSDTKLTNDNISPVFTNRNPRNLEKLRIGYKPGGYHLEKPGRCFWHKLEIKQSSRYVSASIVHFENGEVVRASTQEWALKKQLYSGKDISAFTNLGRVLAQRCLESGILEILSTIEPPNKVGKIASFLKAFEDGGISLKEPEQFVGYKPWDQHRPEKPWEVTE